MRLSPYGFDLAAGSLLGSSCTPRRDMPQAAPPTFQSL
jgi:hypothetical protein